MLWRTSRTLFCYAVQLLLAATLFAGLAAAQCRGRCLNAEDFYKRAVATMASSEFESAIGYLDQAIRRAPGDARFYEARGECLNHLYVLYKDAGAKAINDFTHAIELKPNFAKAFLGRAIAYRLALPAETKDSLVKKTLADLDQAIAIDPKLSAAYTERGMFYYGYVHDNVSAIRDLNSAIDASPNSVAALEQRALFFQVTGELEKATADYTTLIALAPQKGSVYKIRGATYQVLGKYDLAIADYSEVIKLEPTPENHYLRGKAYMEKGDPDLAIADLTACIKRDPSFVEAYSLRAAAYRKLGKIAEAEVDEKMAQTKEKTIIIPKP